MIEHVQTKTEIKALLARFQARPRKRLGQHFLIDGNLMRRLAAAANLGESDSVLEIGAGTGGLTDLLVAAARRVIAVGIDPVLRTILRDRFSGHERFDLIAGDVLAGRNRLAEELLAVLRALAPEDRAHFKVVANLPYAVAALVLVNLLLGETPPVLYCFTVQKEMADRLTAAPRTKDYGRLSILFQSLCDVEALAAVPASAFWPPPQVESTMLRVVPSPEPVYRGAEPQRFMELVRAGFAYRRKTLRFNLRRHLGPKRVADIERCVDLDRRAEELGVGEWVTLDSLVTGADDQR